MTNQLKYYAMALMMGMGMMNAAAEARAAETTIAADIGVFSQYVWRGMPQGGGESSLQGDYSVSYDNLSASVWFATLGAGDVTEFDYTVDYSGEVSGFGYSLGAIAYRFHNGTGLNAEEVYVGASYSVASAKAYYDNKSKNAWVDVGAATEAAGFALDATASYAMPDVGSSEFVNVALSVSKEISLDGMTFSPSFAYNKHLGAFDTAATPDAVVFGVNFSY